METGTLAYLYFVAVSFGIIFGALVLRFSVKWVVGPACRLPYALAFIAVVAGYLVNFAIGFLVGFCVGTVNGGQLPAWVMVFILVAGFFAQSGIYAAIINTERAPVSYGKACLLSLIQLSFAGLILAAISGIVALSRESI